MGKPFARNEGLVDRAARVVVDCAVDGQLVAELERRLADASG